MSDSDKTPQPPVPAPEQQNASDTESELDEGEYYNYPIRGGMHESLNIFNRRPLFILKETWDDTPRPPHSNRYKDYIQVFDDRTELIMDVYPKEHINRVGCALVEWRAPAPTRETVKGLEAEADALSKDFEADRVNNAPEYMLEKALLHAEIIGVSSDSEEDDEVLSVFSSDGEDSHPRAEGKEKYATIYYPLIRRPATGNREIRGKLLGMATHGPKGMARVAQDILDEMSRVDKMPTVNNCF